MFNEPDHQRLHSLMHKAKAKVQCQDIQTVQTESS